MNHCQEILLISSTICSTSTVPLLNITLFLVLQIHHIIACHITVIPFTPFFPTPQPIKIAKEFIRLGGMTTTWDNHRQIRYQTVVATSQWRNKWNSVSKWFPHRGHPRFATSFTPLILKLSLVGILWSNSCHENAQTFEGAALFHNFPKTYCRNTPHSCQHGCYLIICPAHPDTHKKI
jgi:hypothetical protein